MYSPLNSNVVFSYCIFICANFLYTVIFIYQTIGVFFFCEIYVATLSAYYPLLRLETIRWARHGEFVIYPRICYKHFLVLLICYPVYKPIQCSFLYVNNLIVVCPSRISPHSTPFSNASKGAEDDVENAFVHQRKVRKTLTTVQGLSSDYTPNLKI